MVQQSVSQKTVPAPVKSNRQWQRERRCLSCSRPFASTGPGNRICRKCKHLEAWMSGARDFTVHAAF